MNELMLIGDPVGHSLSPEIHGIISEYMGVSRRYTLKRVPKDGLPQFVNDFRESGGAGFNVTLPHKSEIIKELDYLSKEARAIGAVNTVKREGKELSGYNTDAHGFLRQLKSDNILVRNKTVKILGAGGSARAIAYILNADEAKNITIYNRNVEKASDICEQIGGVVDCKTLEEFTPACCDILINTTSVGLYPNVGDSPVSSLADISPDTAVIDIIFNPLRTKFLQLAMDKGCCVYNGVKMLIYQALMAQEIWFEAELIGNDEFVAHIEDWLNRKISERKEP